MSNESNGVAAEAPERFAIGISFGNSSSSIARVTPVRAYEEKRRKKKKLALDSYMNGD